MSAKRHARPEGTGRNPGEEGRVHHAESAKQDPFHPEAKGLMEQVVECGNMLSAWRKVKANNGAPGIDGMTVDELWPWLHSHWQEVRMALLDDRYRPAEVRGVEIPKPGGKGVRQLGIPTVLDRLIQQAIHQILQPLFDPHFSEQSYGFRPGRSAQQAAEQARRYVREGRRWVVDLDLEKFFDRVNHDILMHRVSRKVKDRRLLRLIRRYLKAGMMCDGVKVSRDEGTPQGGPLSPLLSNILLDDLDRELEERGHAFCRYADDCNIYVRSKRSGERVLESITAFLEERLKLKVNEAKSAVARPWERTFLGFSMTNQRQTLLRVPVEKVKRFKTTLRLCLRRGRGRNLIRFIREELNGRIRGWGNYFRICAVKNLYRELDEWIRRRLRNIIWRQWKRPRTRLRKLKACGIDEERARKSAYNGRGPWWNSGASHMNQAWPKAAFDRMNLASLQQLL